MSGSETVLLVDDNEDSREVLAAFLRMNNFQVETFSAGSPLLEMLASRGSDGRTVVLLDIFMPGEDGIDVLRRIRAFPGLQKLPVIAWTAHATLGAEEEYRSKGFNGYATKPILDFDRLVDTLHAFCRSEATADL